MAEYTMRRTIAGWTFSRTDGQGHALVMADPNKRHEEEAKDVLVTLNAGLDARAQMDAERDDGTGPLPIYGTRNKEG